MCTHHFRVGGITQWYECLLVQRGFSLDCHWGRGAFLVLLSSKEKMQQVMMVRVLLHSGRCLGVATLRRSHFSWEAENPGNAF